MPAGAAEIQDRVLACHGMITACAQPMLLLLPAGFEERYAEERRKLAASGERMATDMLAAESVKLRGIMTGPGASVEAVETELRRWVAARLAVRPRPGTV